MPGTQAASPTLGRWLQVQCTPILQREDRHGLLEADWVERRGSYRLLLQVRAGAVWAQSSGVRQLPQHKRGSRRGCSTTIPPLSCQDATYKAAAVRPLPCLRQA